MDTDTMQMEPADPRGPGQRPRWSRRTGRLITAAAAGTVLLGSGAAIGVAMTGGASAATNSSPGSTPVAVAASTGARAAGTGSRAIRCAALVEKATASKHHAVAARLRLLCGRPLLRLALIGGEHGQVTFKGKKGQVTDLFERGTVQQVAGTHVSITAADGTTWTWVITGSTVVHRSGSKVPASDIGTGDKVFAAGTVVNGANDARLVRIARSG